MLHVGGRQAFEAQMLAGDRVLEAKHRRMQSLPAER